MKKYIILGVVALVVIAIISFTGMSVSYTNGEVKLRNLITAKVTDNTSEYDNMWKKISQVAKVAQKDRESLAKIFVGHAKARTVGGDDGSLMKWVQESIPNISSANYTKLTVIITASRDAWTMRQKELIDFKREHDNMLDTIPSKWFLSGKEKIDIPVITSSRTEDVFEKRKDDNVDVF